MHADDFVWTFSCRAEFCDRDRRGVGSEDRVRWRDFIEDSEDLRFNSQILYDCFNDKRRFFESGEIGGRLDASDNRLLASCVEPLFIDVALQALINRT